MPEIIALERKVSYSPNVIALVNWTDFYTRRWEGEDERLPVRGYIFDIELEKIYGSSTRAAHHFILRTIDPDSRRKELFTLGFVKGAVLHDDNTGPEGRLDRDIVYCPYEKSGDKLKTKPYLVKHAGVRSSSELGKGEEKSYPPTINQDMFTISAAEIKLWEKAHRQTEMNPLEYFCTNLPEIDGIEYGNRYIANIKV